MLFSDRAVYIVVYSLRASISLPDIYRHVMNVAVRCRDAPILLVGTHSDVVGGDATLPLAELRAKFPQARACQGNCFREYLRADSFTFLGARRL